jgi:hypothetical protein
MTLVFIPRQFFGELAIRNSKSRLWPKMTSLGGDRQVTVSTSASRRINGLLLVKGYWHSFNLW